MAVTTTSRFEVDWITETVGAIYPEEWERFVSHAESAGIGYRRGQRRLVQAYAQLLQDPDPAVCDAASHAWARWEDAHVSIGAGGFQRNPRWEDDQYRLSFTRLTSHYWSHNGFCEPPLVEGMDRIGHVPAVLIHGRLDVSGPMRIAWAVHQRWPASRLVVDEGEGHGGPQMVESWCAANDALATELNG